MPYQLIMGQGDPTVVEIAAPLRKIGSVTLGSTGGSTPGFSPDNAWQRWVIDEVMISTSAGSVAEVNGPFLGTGITTGGVSGATQPLTMELFLNETSSPGNSIGSTITGIFTTRQIAIASTERLIVALSSDSHWANIVVTITLTGTRYQRRA